MDPVFAWVATSIAILFMGIPIGLFIQYLRNKSRVDNFLEALSELPEEGFSLASFNANRAAYTAALPKKDGFLKEFIAVEGAMPTKKYTPRLKYKSADNAHFYDYSADYFVFNIKEAFDEILLVSSTENEGYTTCLVYKCFRGDEYCYLRVNFSQRHAYHKGDTTKPIYSADNFVVEHFVSQEDNFNVLTFSEFGEAIKIIVPAEQSNMKIDLIVEALERSKVLHTTYDEEVSDIAHVFKMTLSPNGAYVFKAIEMSAAQVANASYFYEDVAMTYEGNELNLPAESVIALGATSLLNGGSVTLFGAAGCGKTSLATAIARTCSYVKEVDVILLDAGIVSSLRDSNKRIMFESALENLSGDRKIFFVDEAETILKKTGDAHSEDNTFALSFLDGLNSSVYKTSMLMTFNAPPEDLNAKIFRSGRINYSFSMKPITEERARRLVNHVKTLAKYQNHIFSSSKFEEYLKDTSTLPGEKLPYAPTGTTTVADVMSCFINKNEHEMLTTELQKILANPAYAIELVENIIANGRTLYKRNQKVLQGAREVSI
jgi:hypothetical protein